MPENRLERKYACNSSTYIVFSYSTKGEKPVLIDITLRPLLPGEVPLILTIFTRRVSWSYIEESTVKIYCGFEVDDSASFEKMFLEKLAEISIESKHLFGIENQLQKLRRKGWAVYATKTQIEAIRPLPGGSFEAAIIPCERIFSSMTLRAKILPPSIEEAEKIAVRLEESGYAVVSLYPVTVGEKNIKQIFNCTLPELLEKERISIEGTIWMP